MIPATPGSVWRGCESDEGLPGSQPRPCEIARSSSPGSAGSQRAIYWAMRRTDHSPVGGCVERRSRRLPPDWRPGGRTGRVPLPARMPTDKPTDVVATQGVGQCGVEDGPADRYLCRTCDAAPTNSSGRITQRQGRRGSHGGHAMDSTLVPHSLQNFAPARAGDWQVVQTIAGPGASSVGAVSVKTGTMVSSVAMTLSKTSVAALLAGTSACGLRTHWKHPSSVPHGQPRTCSAARIDQIGHPVECLDRQPDAVRHHVVQVDGRRPVLRGVRRGGVVGRIARPGHCREQAPEQPGGRLQARPWPPAPRAGRPPPPRAAVRAAAWCPRSAASCSASRPPGSCGPPRRTGASRSPREVVVHVQGRPGDHDPAVLAGTAEEPPHADAGPDGRGGEVRAELPGQPDLPLFRENVLHPIPQPAVRVDTIPRGLPEQVERVDLPDLLLVANQLVRLVPGPTDADALGGGPSGRTPLPATTLRPAGPSRRRSPGPASRCPTAPRPRASFAAHA